MNRRQALREARRLTRALEGPKAKKRVRALLAALARVTQWVELDPWQRAVRDTRRENLDAPRGNHVLYFVLPRVDEIPLHDLQGDES